MKPVFKVESSITIAVLAQTRIKTHHHQHNTKPAYDVIYTIYDIYESFIILRFDTCTHGCLCLHLIYNLYSYATRYHFQCHNDTMIQIHNKPTKGVHKMTKV